MYANPSKVFTFYLFLCFKVVIRIFSEVSNELLQVGLKDALASFCTCLHACRDKVAWVHFSQDFSNDIWLGIKTVCLHRVRVEHSFFLLPSLVYFFRLLVYEFINLVLETHLLWVEFMASINKLGLIDNFWVRVFSISQLIQCVNQVFLYSCQLILILGFEKPIHFCYESDGINRDHELLSPLSLLTKKTSFVSV